MPPCPMLPLFSWAPLIMRQHQRHGNHPLSLLTRHIPVPSSARPAPRAPEDLARPGIHRHKLERQVPGSSQRKASDGILRFELRWIVPLININLGLSGPGR